jgi:hypothetical protein
MSETFSRVKDSMTVWTVLQKIGLADIRSADSQSGVCEGSAAGRGLSLMPVILRTLTPRRRERLIALLPCVTRKVSGVVKPGGVGAHVGPHRGQGLPAGEVEQGQGPSVSGFH